MAYYVELVGGMFFSFHHDSSTAALTGCRFFCLQGGRYIVERKDARERCAVPMELLLTGFLAQGVFSDQVRK